LVRRRAVRHDPATGVRDEVELHDTGHGLMQIGFAAPVADPCGSVLLCSSIGNDFLRAYRREVLLGRTLAAAGWLVGRFHYRGTGNSDGETAAIDLDSLVADVRSATLRLEERGGAPIGVAMATRFAAPVAAVALGGVDRLVLVDPVWEFRQFFREAWRARKVQGATSEAAAGDPPAVEDPIAELRRTGRTSAVGFTIAERLFDSTDGRGFDDLRVGTPERALVILPGTRSAASPLPGSVAALQRDGARVSVEHVGRPEAWWVLDDKSDLRGPEIVATVARWLGTAA